jgi:hypothetical protein
VLGIMAVHAVQDLGGVRGKCDAQREKLVLALEEMVDHGRINTCFARDQSQAGALETMLSEQAAGGRKDVVP